MPFQRLPKTEKASVIAESHLRTSVSGWAMAPILTVLSFALSLHFS
jgi:hypothetical protein